MSRFMLRLYCSRSSCCSPDGLRPQTGRPYEINVVLLAARCTNIVRARDRHARLAPPGAPSVPADEGTRMPIVLTPYRATEMTSTVEPLLIV
jgi:hypothetical protein